MNVVLAHLTCGRDLVLVVFTAPGRVDFRDLLRELRQEFGARVELRQVGPRDQAAMVGGLGACGRELCCSTFLTNFVIINVKMVKMQGLSLNPSSVMGACGRLKCCLEYEYEGYRELLRGMPRIGTRCTCEGCDGRIVDANPLAQTVKVELSDRRVVTVPVADVKTNR
jgi:cell fate regulator YaaT (PSP1 superfamily)